MQEDQTDKLDTLFRLNVNSRKAGSLPASGVLGEMAELCRQGVVRDLELDEAFLLGTASLVADCLKATFDEAPADAAAAPEGPPVKRSGAVNCCPPPGAKGGFTASTAVNGGKPMTVAPWMAGGGAGGGAAGMPKPMKGVGGGPMGGVVAGGGLDRSKPMTVAPWMSAPGSSIQKTLASKGVPLHEGATTTADALATRILHVCEIAKDVYTVEESAESAAEMQPDALKQIAETACDVIDRLCVLGARGESGAGVLGEKGDVDAAAALKALAQALYSRFERLRAGIRRRLAHSLTQAVAKCMRVPRAQAGVRLHALDGGARASSITLVGASAGLQLLAGIVRGFRRPPRRHMALLWDCIMPLHASNGMVDDLTPLLTLVHKPLSLVEVAFLESDPNCANNLLRQLVAYWPPVTSANSSKEVLLLHELEVLLEHCRPDALADAEVRDLVVDRMVSSFEGGKNFRVAERALLLFKADGVVSLLRHHQEAIIPRFVPKLLQASTEHWNHSVLRMIGLALQTLDEMDPEIFARLVGERTDEIRATAVRLNPPEDLTKLEEDAAARVNAMQARREAGNIDLYCLALGHDLGIGAYSRVRYGKLIAKDLQQSLWPQVAVKIMDLDVITSQQYEANVRREIAVLNTLDHPAIVRFVGAFDTKQSTYIVLEYMPNGDLQQVLAQKGSLSVASARFVCAEVLTGLAHMHSRGIVYGDLKPENILLDDRHHCKLSDFGSSRFVEGGGEMDDTPSRVEGTLEYISPEVAGGGTPSSFASDAWALGCVLHQLVAGHTPVLPDPEAGEGGGGEEDNQKALQHIVRFTAERGHSELFAEDFPPEPRPLLQRLLAIEPARRLGSSSAGEGGIWQEVMDNVFFEGIDWAGLPKATPPSLSTGMVSAATAQDRKWNRRKMSMMYCPMPEKYVGGGLTDITELPEEAEGSEQVILPDQRTVHDSVPAPAVEGGEGASAKPPVPGFSAKRPPQPPRAGKPIPGGMDVVVEGE